MSAPATDARFEAVRPRLWSLLKKRFGGADPDADDAIAVGLLAAWEGLCQVPAGTYEDGAIAYARAFRAARRYLRREQARRAALLPLEELERPGALVWPGVTPDFSAALIERLDAQAVTRALWPMLTRRERLMLHLRYGQQQELHEIAARLGCTLSNILGVMNWGLNRYRAAHGLPTFGATPEKLRQRRRAPGPANVPLRSRSHCGRGHSLAGENLRFTQQGTARCRACEREWCREDRARRKK